jgi:GAF domain-containing protein/CheY-like chemotaxis protein
MAGILVVDDELFYREMIADLLRKEGHEVFTAKDGRESLDLCRKTTVDLVLLDVVMPGGMDGLLVLSRLKQKDPELPVIMLTAHEDHRLVLQALRRGAFDYQRKPISAQELKYAVQRALEARELMLEKKEKLRRLSSLEQGAKRLSSMVAGGFKLPAIPQEFEMLNTILELVAEALDCDRVSIMLLDPETRKLKVAVAKGFSKELIKKESRDAKKSISSHVLETGEAVLVKDVDEDERFQKSDYTPQYRTRSFVIAPIKVGDEIIGTINANDKKDRGEFTEDDLTMLKTFSHQVSLTLRHAFLVEDLRRDKDRLELLNEMRKILIRYLEPAEMLKDLVRKCQEMMGVASTSLFLKDELTGDLVLHTGLAKERDLSGKIRIPWGESFTGWVAMKGKRIRVNQLDEKDKQYKPELEWPFKGKIVNLLAAPISISDQVIGVLRLLNKQKGEFSEEDEELLQDVTDSLAVAIRNLRLYEQLQRSVDEVVVTNRMLQQVNDELKMKARELESLRSRRK